MKTILSFFYDYFTSPQSYEDYKEFCLINEIEPKEEDSREYWDYLYGWREDEEANARYAIEEINGPVLVCGSLGLWTGKHSIIPRQFDNISKALFAVLDSAEDYSISYNRGVLTIETIHHDGRNTFDIRKANGQFIKLPQY